MAIADLDFSMIFKRKRMMDVVGHYARPDLLQLQVNQQAWSVTQPMARPVPDATAPAPPPTLDDPDPLPETVPSES